MRKRLIQIPRSQIDTPTHLTSNLGQVIYVPKELKLRFRQPLNNKNSTHRPISVLYRSSAKAFTKQIKACGCHKKATKAQMSQDTMTPKHEHTNTIKAGYCFNVSTSYYGHSKYNETLKTELEQYLFSDSSPSKVDLYLIFQGYTTTAPGPN